MYQILTKSRLQAEMSFARLKAKSGEASRALHELSSLDIQRQDKTSRLREQRLARERFDAAV